MKERILVITMIIFGIIATVVLMKMTYDTAYNAGMAMAEAEYAKRINELEIQSAGHKNTIDIILKESESKRNEYEIKIAEMKKEHEIAMEVFRSRSAKDLRATKASLETVLKEKEKDEIALVESRLTIDAQTIVIENMIKDWDNSDKKLNAEWQLRLDTEIKKYETCKEWKDKLEASLRKKRGLLPALGKGIVVAAAFYLGTKVK